MGAPPHDIAALRARLAGGEGPTLWRSLEAVADTPAFRHFVEAEFPAAARLAAGPDRRQALRLLAASLALAGLGGCEATDNRSQEVPYVRNPARIEPGEGLSYASASLLDGIADGILVTTRDGRPLKVEGNPDHPWSLGGTDCFAQAGILDLYDPARSQTVRYLNRISTWSAFQAAMTGQFAALRAAGGDGLRLITGPVSSPTLLAGIARMREAYPRMAWHVLAPVGREAAYAATTRVFGRRLETRADFSKTRVVVSIGGDLLDAGSHQVGLSRRWADARKAAATDGRLLALHAAASTPTLTTAKADSHLAVEPGDMAGLVAALRAAAGTAAGEDDATTPRSAWLRRAGAALRDARGASIVLAGLDQPVEVQEAVHRLNAELGNLGRTVLFTEALLPEAEPVDGLVEAMRAGAVAALVVLDANPVYAAGAEGFAEALAKVPLKIHAGRYADETTAYADWHVPLAHPLESWGDARSLDGTVTLHQPTVAPLYHGRSAPEILSLIATTEPRDGLTLLREHWSAGRDPGGFEPVWRQALIDGFFRDTAFPPQPVAVLPEGAPGAAAPAAGLAVLFRPDPTVWDGRFADNGWLQELPKPLTKITWSNPVAVSPALASREGLAQGDIVTVALGGRSVEGPVWILPGQAPDTLTLYYGYGRAVPEALSGGLGYNAFAVRPPGGAATAFGATLARTGRAARFATTQDHSSLEGHDFVRLQSVGAPPFAGRDARLPSLYPPKSGEDRAWGMVIDGDACIGCNACVVACQAENNIPIVGAAEVKAGREMHWLRVDRYYSDLKGGEGLDDPDTHFQPVPCMHCEEAPCEVGCPVEATLHDHEGLNLMVYNRCVGTRACSGYCPYKVRRFNYFDYNDMPPALQQLRNPEVTVRGKGVMEKCTYCVQRIANARIAADKSDTAIADGAVVTACQGACPTRAITFGDLNDRGSAVAAARADPRNYALLGELNLRPRTTYLAERLPPGTAADGQG